MWGVWDFNLGPLGSAYLYTIASDTDQRVSIHYLRVWLHSKFKIFLTIHSSLGESFHLIVVQSQKNVLIWHKRTLEVWEVEYICPRGHSWPFSCFLNTQSWHLAGLSRTLDHCLPPGQLLSHTMRQAFYLQFQTGGSMKPYNSKQVIEAVTAELALATHLSPEEYLIFRHLACSSF